MVELERELKIINKKNRKLESACNAKDKVSSKKILITEKELVLQCELEDAKKELAYWKVLEMENI